MTTNTIGGSLFTRLLLPTYLARQSARFLKVYAGVARVATRGNGLSFLRNRQGIPRGAGACERRHPAIHDIQSHCLIPRVGVREAGDRQSGVHCWKSGDVQHEYVAVYADFAEMASVRFLKLPPPAPDRTPTERWSLFKNMSKSLFGKPVTDLLDLHYPHAHRLHTPPIAPTEEKSGTAARP